MPTTTQKRIVETYLRKDNPDYTYNNGIYNGKIKIRIYYGEIGDHHFANTTTIIKGIKVRYRKYSPEILNNPPQGYIGHRCIRYCILED